MIHSSASQIQNKFLGTLSYEAGLSVQESALNSLSQNADLNAMILGLEHTPVATLGVRGKVETDLTVTVDDLRLKGVELHETGRGGQATIHSPGQLVIYPCVKLKALGLGPRDFVHFIERTTQGWLSELGVLAKTNSREPGLFIGEAKVAAFGFKISHGMTSHGLAVNVANDLALFDLIRTCGVSRQCMARLVDFGVSSDLEALFLGWCKAFQRELPGIDRLADLTVLTEAVAEY
jgi:lipoate-protein ligase B